MWLTSRLRIAIEFDNRSGLLLELVEEGHEEEEEEEEGKEEGKRKQSVRMTLGKW
jgi:hypothetical protein